MWKFFFKRVVFGILHCEGGEGVRSVACGLPKRDEDEAHKSGFSDLDKVRSIAKDLPIRREFRAHKAGFLSLLSLVAKSGVYRQRLAETG